MPDVCGYWDRRADDPDFNPTTGEIEEGYAKKREKQYREEKKEEKKRFNGLKRVLSSLNLPYEGEFKDNYSLVVMWGNHLCGDILSKEGRLVANIGREERKPYLHLSYLNHYDKFDVESLKQSLEFKEFLDKNNIHYSEKQSKKEILKQLAEYKENAANLEKETSDLIKKIS